MRSRILEHSTDLAPRAVKRVGVVECVWARDDVIDLIELMRRASIAVHGVDVWMRDGDTVVPAPVERLALEPDRQESIERFVSRSFDEATKWVRSVDFPDPLFALLPTTSVMASRIAVG